MLDQKLARAGCSARKPRTQAFAPTENLFVAVAGQLDGGRWTVGRTRPTPQTEGGINPGPASQAGQCFHQVHPEAGVNQVCGRPHARYTAANYQG